MELTEVITLLATILVAGWFSALIVQALKRATWPSWLKLVLSGIVALLVGIAAAWLSGSVTEFVSVWGTDGMTIERVITFFTLVFTSAATWYRFYLKDAEWARNLGSWPHSSGDSV